MWPLRGTWWASECPGCHRGASDSGPPQFDGYPWLVSPHVDHWRLSEVWAALWHLEIIMAIWRAQDVQSDWVAILGLSQVIRHWKKKQTTMSHLRKWDAKLRMCGVQSLKYDNPFPKMRNPIKPEICIGSVHFDAHGGGFCTVSRDSALSMAIISHLYILLAQMCTWE